MAAAARTPKYMYKTAPGNSGELSIEYGTDLGALTRLEVSSIGHGWLVQHSRAMGEETI